MPQLEGLSRDKEIIRTYYPFYISRFEQRSAINISDIIRRHIRKGVVDICSNCTQNGYYIVGLEKGLVTQGTPPELYEAMKQRTDVIPHTLTLGLFVRRFSTSLTGDEIYYWSKQSTDRVLFEMSQLQQRSYDRPDKMYEGKVATEDLEKIKRMLDDGIINISKDGEKISLAKQRKQTEYTIIRRSKCSSQPS